MKKYLYKTVKVIYDAHLQEYQVWFRNWFRWHYDSCYRWDENPRRPQYYCTKEQAEERAIKRAKSMLSTTEVFRESSTYPFLG